MERWREELYHSELYHYGVKGMRWGVRRYQNPDGSYTAEGRRKYGIGEGSKNANVQIEARKRQNFAKDTINRLKREGVYRVNDINPQGKYTEWKLTDKTETHLLENRINDIKNQEDKDFEKRFSQTNDRFAISKDDFLSINPMFNSKDLTYQVNCQRCAVAFELKKRGMDPQAARNLDNLNSTGLYDMSKRNYIAYHMETNMFNNTKPIHVGSQFDLQKFFKTYNTPGSSGIITFDHNAGAHVVNYTVLNDGTVRIEDSQTGKVYTTDEFDKYVSNPDIAAYNFDVTRLDNCEPNYKAIQNAGIIANEKDANMPSRAEQIQKDRNSRIGAKQNITEYNRNANVILDANSYYAKLGKQEVNEKTSLATKIKEFASEVIKKGKNAVNKIFSMLKHADDDWMLKYVDAGKRYMEAHYGTMA